MGPERKIKQANNFLERNIIVAREKNSKGFKWLKDSFKRAFEQYKNNDNFTKDKIITMERAIKNKFMKKSLLRIIIIY